MDRPQVVANRFQLGDAIGQGSMGEVYRGLDTQTDQAVAIKLLRPEIVANHPELVERIAREGEALRKLNHPNIVKVSATIEEDNHHYLVLEYVGGGTLRDLLKEQPQLPIRRVLEIALDLADALTRASPQDHPSRHRTLERAACRGRDAAPDRLRRRTYGRSAAHDTDGTGHRHIRLSQPGGVQRGGTRRPDGHLVVRHHGASGHSTRAGCSHEGS